MVVQNHGNRLSIHHIPFPAFPSLFINIPSSILNIILILSTPQICLFFIDSVPPSLSRLPLIAMVNVGAWLWYVPVHCGD